MYSHTNYKHAIAVGDQFKLIAYCPKDLADYWDSSIKPDGPDGVLQLNPSDDAASLSVPFQNKTTFPLTSKRANNLTRPDR